jgi:Ca2+-binding EF-hand superfamily protein
LTLTPDFIVSLSQYHFCDTLCSMDTKQMVAELFDVFDVNQDGVISRGEFIALAEALLHKEGLNFSSDIFKQFDANHDNKISRDELVELVLELAL